jgi:siroheme decarboxylase
MSVCISRPEDTLVQRLIVLTQAGLPLLDDPWAWLAEQLGLNIEATLDLLKRLQAEGAIRRIAAVPNHYRLG